LFDDDAENEAELFVATRENFHLLSLKLLISCVTKIYSNSFENRKCHICLHQRVTVTVCHSYPSLFAEVNTLLHFYRNRKAKITKHFHSDGDLFTAPMSRDLVWLRVCLL